MSPTAVGFLGAIAVAVVVMALIQVGAIIYAARLAKRIDALMARLEHDVQPMLERLTTMSNEAARAATLAAQQVERVDRTMSLLGNRVDKAFGGVQRAIVKPAREGVALAAAVKATVETLRALKRRRREASSSRPDEDEALFIG